jgi:hypothetical protein
MCVTKPLFNSVILYYVYAEEGNHERNHYRTALFIFILFVRHRTQFDNFPYRMKVVLLRDRCIEI